MYNVGDKILYPMHGAGIIEDVESQKVLGETKQYYITRIPNTGLKVMIPADSCDLIGIRYIISRKEGLKVLDFFRNEPITADDNWNRRHRDNMVKLKSGNIYQVTEVVKNLMYRDKTKGLSTSERKTLCVATQIVVSELVLSGTAGKDDIESIMNDAIDELI